MKSPGGNKQNMIGTDHAVFSRDRSAFDQRQEITLNTLT